MKRIFIVVVALACFAACVPLSDGQKVHKYRCNFEGAYWDALVDGRLNEDNLPAGTFAVSWCDENSGLAGEVLEPFPGYWEGIALSNFCSMEPEDNGTYEKQLYAYVEKPFSGKNFLICNGFMSGGVELRFENKTSFIESMMVANTTYSRNATGNGYRTADRPLGENESIWIEANGYINGSDEIQATTKFYLYKEGKAAFDGWQKWYFNKMCKVDRVVLNIKWNGSGYNPYPAYFALDDIVVVRQE